MRAVHQNEDRQNDPMVPFDFGSLEFWQFFVTQTSLIISRLNKF
jgi:hypothetical protein